MRSLLHGGNWGRRWLESSFPKIVCEDNRRIGVAAFDNVSLSFLGLCPGVFCSNAMSCRNPRGSSPRRQENDGRQWECAVAAAPCRGTIVGFPFPNGARASQRLASIRHACGQPRGAGSGCLLCGSWWFYAVKVARASGSYRPASAASSCRRPRLPKGMAPSSTRSAHVFR